MYERIGKRITNEEFDIRIVNSGFNRISDYVNSKTSILFECKICKKIFKKSPNKFNKLKCNCFKNRNKYLDNIKFKNIEICEPYVNMRTKIKHKCLNCNLIFISSPKIVSNSVIGCPSCSGKIFSINKYKSLLPKDIILESEIYNGSNQKLIHRCLNCNHIWKTKPNYIIHMGCGCPMCSFSKGEKEISTILNKLNIDYLSQYVIEIDNNKYRFDFYIPNLNLYIEYDGIQHFKPIEYFGGQKSFDIICKNDKIKNNWANNNGSLLRISYLENIDNLLLPLLDIH